MPSADPVDSGLSAQGFRTDRLYDFHDAFDLTQQPTPPARMVNEPPPAWVVAYLAAHPGEHEPS